MKDDKEIGFLDYVFEHWRSIAAISYIIICLFDFVIMPGYIESKNTRVDWIYAIEQSLKYKDSSAQIQALNFLAEKRTWSPLTLVGAGVFHLAFGGILGAAAWTRGQQLIEKTKSSGKLQMARELKGSQKIDNPDD